MSNQPDPPPHCLTCHHCLVGDFMMPRCELALRRYPPAMYKPPYGDSEIIRSHRTYCTWQRRRGWLLSRLTGTCGYEGRFWEPAVPGDADPR